jgi:tungstate transport system permease protein
MDVSLAFSRALSLIVGLDPQFLQVVELSLRVSLSAVILAAVIGLPMGALLAIGRFPGRSIIVVVINALMGLPPVVAGLIVFLLLSRSGPMGAMGWLFSPTAMIVAQTLLVLPIVIALTRGTIEELWREYREHLISLDLTGWRAVPTLLWDGRFALTTGILAGFGRASAEVGAVLIVGGNIAGYTRTMTTSIALETSKGDLPVALGLGILLISLTLTINALAFGVSRIGVRFSG